MDLEAYLILERFKRRISWMSDELRFAKGYVDLTFEDPHLNFNADHPERNVSDMAESQQYVQLRQKVPHKFRTRLTSKVTMEATINHMRLNDTEKKLERARKRMQHKQIGLARQWKNLERDENKLKNNFIHFDKFVKENNHKRTRAQNMLDEERKIIAERQKNIDDLQNLRVEMEDTMVKMEKSIERQNVFKMFLQKLINLAPEFKTILDVVNRYNCLVNAKESLIMQQKSNLYFFETSKAEMMKLIEEKNFVIMGLNNQIANLQARYENANIKALESEELVTEIKNNAVKQLSEIDTVKTSIWNVYVHMTLSKKHPIKIKKDNVEEQMMYINRTLTELSKVNKLINKKRTFKMK